MATGSLVTILLAMAIGLIAGYEIGRRATQKHIMNLIHEMSDATIKRMEKEAEERQKRVEEIQKSAVEVQNAIKALYEKAQTKTLSAEDRLRNEIMKKEQRKDGD